MTRSILQNLTPCFIALAIAFVVLLVLKRLSGARWNLKRLRELHSCENGGVQSLAFVLTLPLFIMVMMFIVQVSQLMIGITIVHYSAYASARSASVWLPAHRPSQIPALDESENRLAIEGYREVGDEIYVTPNERDSYKFRQIRSAAVLGVAPICPSRDLNIDPASLSPDSAGTIAALQRMYRAYVPNSQSNARINPRLANKVSYADRNTFVVVSWRDARNRGGSRETYRSPTFNPRNHPNPAVPWHPEEVGWQDPITVHVTHRFALLPGPGRMLARYLVPSTKLPDEVARRITRDAQNYSEPVYTVNIHASATVTNEGMKSVRPFEQMSP